MADQKLTALTAMTSPTTDDLLYIVDDPSGTPASRKITLANLLGATSGSVVLASTTYLYFGDTGTDGSWRIGRSGTSLVVERRESSVWVEKGAFVA